MLELLQQKLLKKTALGLYDKFSRKIVELSANIELQPGENIPAILVYKNPDKEELYYSIVTMDTENKVVRILRTEGIRSLIEKVNMDMNPEDLLNAKDEDNGKEKPV